MTLSISTVFVVEDEESVRRALERLLRSASFRVLTFSSSSEFLEACDPSVPGCVLLDIAMPEVNGLELQKVLKARGAAWPIIFLTGRADIPMTVQAMKHGAMDFLTKPVKDQRLLAVLHQAIERDRLQRKSQAELVDLRRRLATLTPRQREVLSHVVLGKLNKQVAAELGTVEKTVKVHRAEVMRKMQAGSLAELVRIAQELGIGAPGQGSPETNEASQNPLS